MDKLNIDFELVGDVLLIVFPEGVKPGKPIVFAQFMDAVARALKSLDISEPENENNNG